MTNVMNGKKIDLGRTLADLHGIYLMTLGAHWNMEDPRFIQFHELLEGQYKEVAEEMDLVAERMRQLGQKAPATVEEMLSLKTVNERHSGDDADSMLEGLLSAYKTICQSLGRQIQESESDFATADFLTEVLRAADKRAWMLRSHL